MGKINSKKEEKKQEKKTNHSINSICQRKHKKKKKIVIAICLAQRTICIQCNHIQKKYLLSYLIKYTNVAK